MKHQLATFAHDIDAFCAKLNDGLTAVAVLLGFLLLVMAVARAPDFAPGLSASGADVGASPSVESAWGAQ